MTTPQLLLTVLLAAALSPAMAEEADPAQEARREVRVERIERAEGDAHFRTHADTFMFAQHGGHMVAGMRGPRQPVKNAPYTATLS